MPKFRVELERVIESGLGPNPFYPTQISLESKSRKLVRSWEFEAKNEAQVRKFLKEAYDNNLPNVRGFILRSISVITEGERHGN